MDRPTGWPQCGQFRRLSLIVGSFITADAGSVLGAGGTVASPAPMRGDRSLVDVVCRVASSGSASLCDPIRAELRRVDALVTEALPKVAPDGDPQTSQYPSAIVPPQPGWRHRPDVGVPLVDRLAEGPRVARAPGRAGEGGTAMRLASGATCGLGPECECDLGWCRGAYRKYRNSHRRWIHRTLVVGTSSVLIPASARLVGIHQRAGHAHRARALGEDSSCQIADIASDRAGCLRLQIQSLE